MEGIMAGKPTISTVLGGLQDQMGFVVSDKDGDRDMNLSDFTSDTPSNSTGKISKEHGQWTYPLWPQMNLQGSPQTPYIYDSRPNINDIADGIKYWYDLGPEERQTRGLAGRDWAIKNGYTNKGMCDAAIESIETCFDNFKPRKRYTLIDTTAKPKDLVRGILI